MSTRARGGRARCSGEASHRNSKVRRRSRRRSGGGGESGARERHARVVAGAVGGVDAVDREGGAGTAGSVRAARRGGGRGEGGGECALREVRAADGRRRTTTAANADVAGAISVGGWGACCGGFSGESRPRWGRGARRNTLRAERRRRLRRRRRACVRVVLVVCLGWRPGVRGGVGYGCAGYHGAGR